MKPIRFVPTVALALLLLAAAPMARAQSTYQVDSFVTGTFSGFNNSQGTENEDNFVANSFQVVAGGTTLVSFTFLNGTAATNAPITLVIYTGSSLTKPQAGAGLIRISTTTTMFSSAANTFQTLSLFTPITLSVGQIFYAAILRPGVTGTMFPFGSDAGSTGNPPPLNRSFFDVGATQGAAYNLDVTSRAVVLGGTHSVVGAGVQAAGNLILRVNAIPEPGSLGLAGLGLAVVAVAAKIRRRKAQPAASA